MLHQEVLKELERLEAKGRTVDLVLAAMEGEEGVERVLTGGTPTGAAPGDTVGDDGLPGVYLESVTVCGFRGIGPETTLEIPPGPGLTIVTGRNGSGKSSFAEALEVLLTGDTLRWSEKRGPWKEGWKNLHHTSPPRIAARFQVEGKRGLTTATATWPEGADYGGVRRTAQHHGERRTDLAGVGWEIPLDLYRPLLSYNELGVIGAGPTALFDTLTAALGLESLSGARKPLSQARLARTRLDKVVTRERLDRLLPALKAMEDPRAEAAVAMLQKIGAELEESHSLVSGLRGGEAEQAEGLARLLEQALEHHRRHGDEPCPVCGVGTLDPDWRRSTQEQAKMLNQQAARYRRATKRRDRAFQAARGLVAVPSIPSADAIDTSPLHAAWRRWGSLPADAAEVPEHLLAGYEEVAQEAAAVAEQAASLHSEREEKWAQVSPDLMAWVAKARRAEESMEAVGAIQDAEKALKEVTEALRNARWAPIESEALGLWKDLRLQSNVDLRSVKLAGSGTRRRVELTVEVDGTEAPALAVVSQGELSCLALSLFFPRATLADSPFRFMVIDDPVQAMDPARVDGLAAVFDRIAQERQLVVFTHDDRLPESLRRMKIAHTCKKVTRRPGSVIEVADSRDPVVQYFSDARSLISDDALPDNLARRVIPGICRNGLEAACIEAVRRRRLGQGEDHAAVEGALERAHKLTHKAALVLFDDMKKSGNVSDRIRHQWGASFENAFWGANKGAHRSYGGNLSRLISDCRELAKRLRRL